MRLVGQSTIFPCCIKKFTSNDPSQLKVLTSLAGIRHNRVVRYLDEDWPLSDIMSRKLEDCTFGVMKAQHVPHNSTAIEMYTLPDYIKRAWCVCDNITGD